MPNTEYTDKDHTNSNVFKHATHGVYSDHSDLVNKYDTHYSGNFGSTQIPTSSMKPSQSGGKRKYVGSIYKSKMPNFLKTLKKAVMSLKEIKMTGKSKKKTKRSKKGKGKKGTKSKGKGKGKGKKASTRKGGLRGGSTVTYKTGGVQLGPKDLALANPVPFEVINTTMKPGYTKSI
tara:strand:- start:3944 stop:4471 length:528 start_codon:yes stop_codon:yes gene_type:complete